MAFFIKSKNKNWYAENHILAYTMSIPKREGPSETHTQASQDISDKLLPLPLYNVGFQCTVAHINNKTLSRKVSPLVANKS